VRHVAALARLGDEPTDDYDAKLTTLLERVRDDEDARQEYVDILELLGPTDPRTASYRRLLTSRLF
jgi:putative thioredoxin